MRSEKNSKTSLTARYREGQAVYDILDSFHGGDGNGVPCQVDGGLKCFGHPIGASGLRMAYENDLQLLGRAGQRQLRAPSLGLTHNLGGVPYLGMDVLVNNAGFLRDRMLVNMAEQDWGSVVRVHLKGTFARHIMRRIIGACSRSRAGRWPRGS